MKATRVAGAHGGGCRETWPTARTGPDLSSHDGFYEQHGTDLTSDAEQFDKTMSRGDHPGTAGSGQRAALQNPATADPYSRQSTSVHPSVARRRPPCGAERSS